MVCPIPYGMGVEEGQASVSEGFLNLPLRQEAHKIAV